MMRKKFTKFMFAIPRGGSPYTKIGFPFGPSPVGRGPEGAPNNFEGKPYGIAE